MEQPTSTRSGLEQRPTHWNYGCAYRLGFHEQDWIAMSELGLGPDDVHQAKDGTVYSVTLPPRSYSDHKLQHLREFINLRCIWMNRIGASRETVELVRSWSSEWSVYAGMLRKPESGWILLLAELFLRVVAMLLILRLLPDLLRRFF